MTRDERVRALTAERYTSTWWKTPAPVTADDELTQARRLALLVADDELTGGGWVQHGLTRRWVAA